MRRLAVVAAAISAAFIAIGAVAPAHAELTVTVDKSTQRMLVERDGAELFVWPVSTGAPGHDTPSGTFTPNRMDKEHFSKEWDDAPMPNSIFFTLKGHAIHGTTHKSIGQAVSHGCVRLELKNAAILFDLVKQEGMQKTHVILTGETPGSARIPQVARQGNPGGGFRDGFADNQPYVNNDGRGDGDIVGAIPQRRVVVREGNDGRYYYYRERPYYPPPPRPRRYVNERYDNERYDNGRYDNEPYENRAYNNGPLGFLFGR